MLYISIKKIFDNIIRPRVAFESLFYFFVNDTKQISTNIPSYSFLVESKETSASSQYLGPLLAKKKLKSEMFVSCNLILAEFKYLMFEI